MNPTAEDALYRMLGKWAEVRTGLYPPEEKLKDFSADQTLELLSHVRETARRIEYILQEAEHKSPQDRNPEG